MAYINPQKVQGSGLYIKLLGVVWSGKTEVLPSAVTDKVQVNAVSFSSSCILLEIKVAYEQDVLANKITYAESCKHGAPAHRVVRKLANSSPFAVCTLSPNKVLVIRVDLQLEHMNIGLAVQASQSEWHKVGVN